MKRYIVAVTGLNEADEKLFIEFISEKQYNWWHRLDNVWLITDRSDESSVSEIRDFLMPLESSKVCLVTEVPDDLHWAAFAPRGIKQETFTWVHRNWTKKVDT